MDDFSKTLAGDNPYAVTTDVPALQNDPASLKLAQPTNRYAFGVIWLAIPLMIVAAGVSLFHIESIVISGISMLVYGIVVMFVTRSRTELARFRWFAWACLAFPPVVFALIFFNGWSPKEALRPVSSLVCVFAASKVTVLLIGIAGYRERLRQATIDDIGHASSESKVPDLSDFDPLTAPPR